MKLLDADDDCPVRDQFAMPAEWAPHQGTFMQWPARVAAFGGPEALTRARQAYGEVARAIARFEPVTMIVRAEDHLEARLTLGPQIGLLDLPHDDGWARDSGPTFVTGPAGAVAGVHWRFNAWGGKYTPFAADAALGAALLEHLKLRIYRAPLVMEGGAIHTDGAGTLMTTEQCLLNENRNPELTRQQIEARLALYAGALRVIWLGSGFTDAETDGHIDNIACFAPGGKILLGVYERGHPNHGPALESLHRLHEARSASGRAFEIVELQQPSLRRKADGTVLEASYVNFYVCNGAVIVPAFDDPADEAAAKTIAACFPGRELVQVNAEAIVEGGGGIHCITQQFPAPQS